MKKILSLLLILVLSISVFTGCGKTEDKAVEKEVAKTEEAVEKEEVAQEETVEAEEELGWPRTLTDARGVEVTFESKPERIVPIWEITAHLLALDNPPIASNMVDDYKNQKATMEYMKKYTIEDTGSPVNFEKLAELKPDLILIGDYAKDEFEQYEKIAPVFVIETAKIFGEWRYVMREISTIVGKEKEAEEFIAKENLEMNKARKSLDNIDESVGLLFAEPKSFYALSPKQLSTYYDNENGLGLKLPEGWPEKNSDLSLESLSEINPGVLFICVTDYDVFMSEMKENSVWNALSAVKNGKVYTIEKSGLFSSPLTDKYARGVILEALAK